MSQQDENEDDGSIEVTLEENSATETPVVEKEETASAKSDRDLEEHSESVRKRIDKLTYKVREAERREQAALEFAKGLKGQLDTYQDRANRLDKSLVQEFDNRLKTQEKMVREELRRAIDEGNIDAQIDAQSSLAALAVENDKLRQSRARREQDETNRASQAAARPPVQAAPQTPQPDPKARSWAERNEWFGNDRAMTATAYAIHSDLIEVEGFDPSSDDYYKELDSRIRSEFPHKFKSVPSAGAQNPRPQPMVGSARNTVKSSGNKVKLTESQIRVAKSLGVSLEEYARHTRMQQQG